MRLITACLFLIFSGWGHSPLWAEEVTSGDEPQISLRQQIKPIVIENGGQSSRLNQLDLLYLMGSEEIQVKVSGGCTEEVIETNIHSRGEYLAQLLIGYGTDIDSYWSKTVYVGDDRTISSREENVSLPLQLKMFSGTSYRIEPLEILAEKVNEFEGQVERKLKFYQESWVTKKELPVRLEVICQPYEYNKVLDKLQLLQKRSRVKNQKFSLPIKYMGDPALKLRLQNGLP